VRGERDQKNSSNQVIASKGNSGNNIQLLYPANVQERDVWGNLKKRLRPPGNEERKRGYHSTQKSGGRGTGPFTTQ